MKFDDNWSSWKESPIPESTSNYTKKTTRAMLVYKNKSYE
jgi:hypothetical protein